MGATRVAAQAGAMAATMVTSSPTPRATTTVRGSTAGEVVGISTPISSSSERMRAARPTPSSSPIPPATRPMTAASTRIPPRTWRRVAPTARSSATSRRRWATSTLNVFQMTKEPTRTETPAKTSMIVVKIPIESCTACVPSLGHLLPRQRLDPLGEHLGDPVAQLRRRDPLLGHHVDLVDDPGLVEHLLGGGQVEAGEGGAQEAVGLPEADDPDQPERAPAVAEHHVDRVPELVARLLDGAGVEGHLSIPDGVRPSRKEAAPASRRSSVRLVPSVGAPPGWIGSPCSSSTSAKPKTDPSATATPGTPLTVATTSSSSGRTCPPVVAASASNAAWDLTTTSVPDVRPL